MNKLNEIILGIIKHFDGNEMFDNPTKYKELVDQKFIIILSILSTCLK